MGKSKKSAGTKAATPSIVPTRRKRGTKTPVVHHDPRIAELAAQVFEHMNAAGLSTNKLAVMSGVDQSQLSKYFRGEAGLSQEAFLNVLQALNLGWGIKRGEAGDVRDVQLAGSITSHGVVRLFGGAPTMPAVFLIDGDHGRFKKGDRVLIGPGGWTAGKYVMVRHPDGQNRVHMCEERSGLRLLVSTESVIFDETVHEVVGVLDSRIERL